MSQTKPIALITGASSGIGKATAQRLAQEGYALILCGRRIEKLQALAQSLEPLTRCHISVFDVRNKQSLQAEIDALPAEFQDIDLLVNNAGNAHGLDLFQDADLDDWDAMMDINVKGLLYVTKVILPRMLAKGKGHIINIGSTAGKEVYPKGNAYCASKHAVNALNEAMRIDLNGTGIRVGAIHPGLVETEFSEVRFKGDKEKAAQVYQGYRPLKAEDIADIIAFVVTRPYHVNIADLVVMSLDQASSTIVNKQA